jgi:hypothetical protein
MRTDAVDARPMRAAVAHGCPRVSVVSVVDDDSPATLRVIAERSARWEHHGVELVFVCASRQPAGPSPSVFGGGRLLYAPADATEEELRAIGLAAATGDVVMLVGDAAAVDDRWIEHLSMTGGVRTVHPGA